MELNLILDSIFRISDMAKVKLKEHVHEIHLPKGFHLIEEDKIERNIYFLKKGMARAYIQNDGKDITFWFGKEGDTIVSMKNYVANSKGYEQVELLEECQLYELRTTELHRLFEVDIEIANWGRKFAEQELMKTEEILISRLFKTATEQYLDLLKHNPDLIQRVQLSYIASYLGITQVSLSRIRAKLK